jgi:spore cortex formation protein SpoVR/YcgB (stage V sporulation)
MKVVCIDNNNTSTETITSYKFITLGKSYDAIKLLQSRTTSKLYDIIICDDDVVRFLLKSRFITLEVHREQMLNKILK